jgi:TDG/mug DNA glycosylase family protein
MRLQPLLKPGLSVVFVGTRPGTESLATGNYYANPSNSFYADLHKSGWTNRRLSPIELQALVGFGIGLDDVYEKPQSLRRRLENASPLAVCFNSKGAIDAFAGRSIPGHWRGDAAGRWAVFKGAPIVWAVPDSSGLAAGYRNERPKLLRLLRRRVERLKIEHRQHSLNE